MNKRKALLVDQHPVVLESLATRINGEEDLAVCAIAKTPAEAIKALSETQPDVISLALAFKDGHGLELIRNIRSQTSNVPILCSPCSTNPPAPSVPFARRPGIF